MVQGLEVGSNKPSIFQAINKHITTWQSSNEATNYQSGTELSRGWLYHSNNIYWKHNSDLSGLNLPYKVYTVNEWRTNSKEINLKYYPRQPSMLVLMRWLHTFATLLELSKQKCLNEKSSTKTVSRWDKNCVLINLRFMSWNCNDNPG